MGSGSGRQGEGQMWDGTRERRLGIEYGMKREGGGGGGMEEGEVGGGEGRGNGNECGERGAGVGMGGGMGLGWGGGHAAWVLHNHTPQTLQVRDGHVWSH